MRKVALPYGMGPHATLGRPELDDGGGKQPCEDVSKPAAGHPEREEQEPAPEPRPPPGYGLCQAANGGPR